MRAVAAAVQPDPGNPATLRTDAVAYPEPVKHRLNLGIDRPADPALLMQAFSDALESTLDRKLEGLSTQLDQRVQAHQEALSATIRDIVRDTIREELDTLSERQSARDVQLVEQVRGVLEERKADARLSRWQRLWTWVRQGGQST